MKTERTSQFLMANIGSEVSRIISAKNNNDFALVKDALERVMTIITQLKSKPEMKERIYEINTLELVIRDNAQLKPTLEVSDKNLQSYFIPFAMRVIE